MAPPPKKLCIRPVGPSGIVHNWSSTDINVYKKEHLWIISHYSFQDAKQKHLKSSTFTSDFDGSTQCTWYLYLKPNGEANSEDFVSLYLHLDRSSQCKSVFAKIRFSVINNEQKEMHRWESSISEFRISTGDEGPNHLSWGCGRFLKKSVLLNSKNNLLPNDKLTILCEIKYSQVIFTSTSVQSSKLIPVLSPVPSNRLSEDFGLLLSNGDFADVVISVSGTEFPVHKTILVARSPVFSAMFQRNGMQESSNNCINIDDIRENVMVEILRYIYTGNVENLDTLTEELLGAADKYLLDELKAMCEDALSKNLSVDSAATTLALADLHHASELKSKTMDFIVSNSGEVMQSEGWKSVIASNLQLLNEVCQALSRQLTD